MTALPTLDELTAALSASTDPSDPTPLTAWRHLIQRCLSHACSAPSDVQPVSQLLKDALAHHVNSHDTHHHQQQQQQHPGNSNESEDAVISTVVESIWLHDCLYPESRQTLVDIVKVLTSCDASSNKDQTNDDTKTKTTPLIPPSLLQSSLEFPLLRQCSLLPPATAANIKSAQKSKGTATATAVDPILLGSKQRYMKVNANLYYRQHKFNLFVEESEGWGKIVDYLICCCCCCEGDERSSESGGDNTIILSNGDSNTDNGSNINNNSAARDVRAIIGTFDLDPNRVLDVTLDVLEWELKCLVDRQYSNGGGTNHNVTSWTVQTVQSTLQSIIHNNNSKINALLSIIRDLDGQHGHRAVAHLLGFKYRYYTRGKERVVAKNDKAGDKSTTTTNNKNDKATTTTTTNTSTNNKAISSYPTSLHLCAAFLCTQGILEIHDLLPHILLASSSSTPEKHSLLTQYSTHCQEKVTKLKKMGVISLNKKSSDKDDGDVDEDQGDPFVNDAVIGIFRSILMVGSWEEATAFLANAAVGEFKDVVMKGDALTLEKMMKNVVLAACSLSDGVALDVCGWVSWVVGNHLQGDDNGGMELEDLSGMLLDPLACLVGSGKIRLSQSLYVKLCRMYQVKLAAKKTSEDSKELEEAMIDTETMAVLATFLVPSLSLFPPNPDLSRELWHVLQLLPHIIRYKLYSAWRHPALEKGVLRSMLPKDIKAGNFPKPLDCIESEIKTSIEAKSIMKRISKENIEDRIVPLPSGGTTKEIGKGRQLSEASHNNPLVVFSYILNQIESYDNMILLMVDAFRYVTSLGLDVIGYCLLLSLGGVDDGKNRTKTIGLNTEQWLASLETFTGAFYKKFPDVELRGLLIYITQRLQEGHASELGVLRSLIKTAGGYGFVDYDSTSALSELQLDGRCGSRLLKLETSSFGVIDNVNPRASRMLRTVLQGNDLGVIILILLSQVRQNVLYSKSESKEHIKVMGRLYDNCESVLCLLLEYISDSSDDPPEGPSTKEKFANSLPPLDSLVDKYGLDTATAWMLIRPLFRKSMFYMDDKKLVSKSSSGEPPAFLKLFSPTPEMTDSYQKLLPESAWKHITTSLFEAFFSLSIYDIQCPSERYNIEIGRLNKEIERLNQLQHGRGVSALAAAAAAAGGSERQIRDATKFTDASKKELERLKFNVDKLSKDFSRQQKRCELVQAKLEAQKDVLIPSSDPASGSVGEGLASAFLTFCVYPRFLCSPEDALFCAYFIKMMHKMKVPGFSTIELIDGIVNAITGSLYCVTEDEAGNLAIFLNEIWKSANLWRYDNDAFASELKGTPGSILSSAFSAEKSIGDHSTTDGITHDDYKALFSQWHLKIGSASVGCLNSSEYMHTRCALIILSRIVLVYPTQPKVGDKFLDILSVLQADESRPDIRATAQGYASQLAKARDEGMWKEENIAVTKARQEKEQMKVEERRKKLAQQHEAMRKDTEKLDKQLGVVGRDNRDFGRGRDDMRGRQWGGNQGPPLSSAAPVFVPRDGAPMRDLHSGPPRRDGHDHGRDRRDEVWERDRGGGGTGHGRHNDRGHPRPTAHGGSDGRDDRRHGDDSRSRRKRSRSAEPGEANERDKRFKPAARNSTSPPRGGRSSGPQSSRGDQDRSDRRPERKTRSGRH